MLRGLRDDPTAAAIVIACAGRTFVSGADITEFGTPKALQEPNLPMLCALLEQPQSLCFQLFSAMGAPGEALLDASKKAVDAFPKVSGGGRELDKIYISAETEAALSEAERQAQYMGDEYVSVEHLALGLICAPDGTLKLIRTVDGQVIFDEKLPGEAAATEVGADEVVPWQADRSIVVWRGERAAKSRARWLATVRSATKQSRRSWVPEVAHAVDTDGLAARVRTIHGDFREPEVRAAAGKPEEGTIRLRAFHEGGQVVIEISDDGAGLDIDRIRARAAARDVVPASQLERMGDQAKNVYDLAAEGVRFTNVPDADELRELGIEVSNRLGEASALLSEPTAEAVEPFVAACQARMDDLDRRVNGLIHSDEPARVAVPRAMYFRYLKRILANAAGAVEVLVQPAEPVDPDRDE